MSLEEAIKKIESLEIENSNLKLEINTLRKMVFGHKRENTPNNQEQMADSEQCSLFATEEEANEHLEKEIEEKIEEVTVYKKKNKKEKKAGIKKSALKDVVIKRSEFVINENDKCPECNGNLKAVGKKVVRQEIEFKPAQFDIREIVQVVYKCEKCGMIKDWYYQGI